MYGRGEGGGGAINAHSKQTVSGSLSDEETLASSKPVLFLRGGVGNGDGGGGEGWGWRWGRRVGMGVG